MHGGPIHTVGREQPVDGSGDDGVVVQVHHSLERQGPQRLQRVRVPLHGQTQANGQNEHTRLLGTVKSIGAGINRCRISVGRSYSPLRSSYRSPPWAGTSAPGRPSTRPRPPWTPSRCRPPQQSSGSFPRLITRTTSRLGSQVVTEHPARGSPELVTGHSLAYLTALLSCSSSSCSSSSAAKTMTYLGTLDGRCSVCRSMLAARRRSRPDTKTGGSRGHTYHEQVT